MTLTQRSSPRFNNSQKSNEESCKEEKSVEEKENKTSTSLKRARYSEVSTILPKKNAITSNGAHTLNDLDNIISKFHATARPAALPCREEEFTEILGCLETSIDTSNGQYISGVPGTGKTATVHAVMNTLQIYQNDKDIKPFDYIEINGMKLSEPAQAYSIILEILTGEKTTPKNAADILEKYFSKPNKRDRPCVVLIDELDQFLTKKQKVIYNLFDWPNRTGSKLIIVAIANTMDLPERVMLNKVSSRIGLTRLNFAPYTHQQLIKIIESRLEGTKIFKKDAIEVCARKVSSVSGDARRALQICRYAIHLIQSSTDPSKLISVDVVLKAVRELSSSPALLSLMNASVHQMLFLVCIIKQTRKTGISDVVLVDVIIEHMRVCKTQGVVSPTPMELFDIASELGEYKWILVESNKGMDRSKKLRLNMMEEDVMMVLHKSIEPELQNLL